MVLSSESKEYENGGALSAARHPARAGLRITPSDTGPTGVFVVIEMAVLVIVAALAMAAIIVSIGDEGGSDRGSEAVQRVADHLARDASAKSSGTRSFRAKDAVPQNADAAAQ